MALRLSAHSIGGIAAIVVLGIVPAALQAFGLSYFFRLAELTMVFAILAASLNLVSGTAGLMSLGHAAFYGVGAYTTALLSTYVGTDGVIDILASAVVAGTVALVVATPAIRLVRIFFTVATLAAGEIINAVLLNWDSVTRGPMGIRGIAPLSLFGIKADGRLGTYYGIAIVTIGTIWVIHRMVHSYYGNALRSLREDDVSAAAMGLDVRVLKLSAFAISGGLAGVAGSLQAHLIGYISPDMFQLDTSILVLTMVVVGGLGSLPGAIVGACILILVPEFGREFGHFRMVVVGVVLYASILLMPKGLITEARALRALKGAGRGSRYASQAGTGKFLSRKNAGLNSFE
jgi:branched-chain amino acid transport system permease protein